MATYPKRGLVDGLEVLWQLFILPIILLLCMLSPVAAFQFGGHYPTLTNELSEAYAHNDNNFGYKVIEAVCTEIPDLSQEFDAITQRWNVVKSIENFAWSFNGTCTGDKSLQMVQTQFYLHGLTGLSSDGAEGGAIKIIRSIDGDIRQTSEPRKLSNLYCARGFAVHLLGDTIAHTRLDWKGPANGERVLYDTGMGHFRDDVSPDFMLKRSVIGAYSSTIYDPIVTYDHWTEIIAKDVLYAPTPEVGSQARNLAKKLMPDFLKLPEVRAATDPLGHIEDPQGSIEKTRLADKRIEDVFSNALEEGTAQKWKDALVESLKSLDNEIFKTRSCNEQLQNALGLRRGNMPAAPPLPDCNVVWRDYLRRAQSLFPYRPKKDCDPSPRME